MKKRNLDSSLDAGHNSPHLARNDQSSRTYFKCLIRWELLQCHPILRWKESERSLSSVCMDENKDPSAETELSFAHMRTCNLCGGWWTRERGWGPSVKWVWSATVGPCDMESRNRYTHAHAHITSLHPCIYMYSQYCGTELTESVK